MDHEDTMPKGGSKLQRLTSGPGLGVAANRVQLDEVLCTSLSQWKVRQLPHWQRATEHIHRVYRSASLTEMVTSNYFCQFLKTFRASVACTDESVQIAIEETYCMYMP